MSTPTSHRRTAPKEASRSRATTRVLPVAAAFSVVALLVGTAQAEPDAAPAGAADLVTSAAAEEHSGHGESGVPAAVGTAASAAEAGAPAAVEPLTEGCQDSDLPAHTGFQIGPACVDTAFGEVAAAEDNPQLLIVEAPDEVTVGQAFTIKVSTRNLVRDRFLPAAEGGYYLEPSTLNGDGLVRGHFHTACRVLGNSGQAPEPARQAVFVATEDGGGGTAPDTVTVTIPGLTAAGQAQCATWAGDASHRMPMMQFANQIPAFDAVRITVASAGEGTPADAGRPADADADETPSADDTPRPDTAPEADAGEPVDGGEPVDADAGQPVDADAPEGATPDEDANAAEGADERTDSGR